MAGLVARQVEDGFLLGAELRLGDDESPALLVEEALEVPGRLRVGEFRGEGEPVEQGFELGVA